VAQVSADHKQAVIIETNCETDFVARDTNFIHFCEKLSQTALKNKVNNVEQLLTASCESSAETMDALRQHLIMKIGENINVRRCQYVSAKQGVIAHYIHSGRIGVLVELADDNLSLAKDIAMHIAANNPECISAEDVSQSRKDAEKAILIAQAETSGKPKDIIEKMIAGRLQKFVAEISLYGQPFVKNADMSVGQLVKEAKTSVLSFVRYEVGEGIEKKQEDFAKEVMAQVKGG
jgi:elongation factor Ts